MSVFFRKLVEKLNLERPKWRENSVVLLDNASYHTNPDMLQELKSLQVPTMYLGPYSYSTAPCELIFAALKMGMLNPKGLPTGKK